MTDRPDGQAAHQITVDSLAVLAVSIAEMGGTELDARLALVKQMERLRLTDTGALREAAAAIAHLPQPPDEPAEDLERRQAVYDALGLPSSSDHLAAALTGREWLTNLADLLDEYFNKDA